MDRVWSNVCFITDKLKKNNEWSTNAWDKSDNKNVKVLKWGAEENNTYSYLITREFWITKLVNPAFWTRDTIWETK